MPGLNEEKRIVMIELIGVGKTYQTKRGPVEACRDIDLKIETGEIFGIIGFSGAGKSTLIRCINLLERPTAGRVIVDGAELTAPGADIRAARRNIGMIFQQFNLLMQKTALQNICFPLLISGVKKQAAAARARELLELVGLPDKADAYPAQLSGGQKQRVAIARALATNPRILLCDEATSALDPTTTTSILQLLRDLNRRLGITIVIITHEMRVIEEICGRVAIMDESRIAEVGRVEEVFVSPQSAIGKKLLFPQGKKEEFAATGKCLRIVFDGTTAYEPVLGNMMIECGEPCNILYADTRAIDGRAVGQMVVQLPENETAARRMRAYLDLKGIQHSEEAFEDVH